MRRAFTILETLVVVLLLVLIGAIVAPIAVDAVERASVDESPTRLESAVMLARADAQRRQVIIQLWARRRGAESDAVTELFTVDAAASRQGREVGRGGEEGPEAAEHEVATLPVGVSVSRTLPTRFRASSSRSSDPDSTDVASVEAELDEVTRDERVMIATFMPTGLVSTTGAWCVYSSKGKAWSVRINSWTGTVTATAIYPVMSRADANDEEETSNTPSGPKAAPLSPTATRRDDGTSTGDKATPAEDDRRGSP